MDSFGSGMRDEENRRGALGGHVAEGIRMIAVGRCLHWCTGRDSEGKHQ
ncbi:hypothetical protein OH687_08790 [Burkholderia anthina]|nr:hypothetical protein OH687_08790 [Burkholderia anthina]